MQIPKILPSAVGKRNLTVCATIFMVVLTMLCLFVSQPLFLRQLDNRIYDVLLLTSEKIEPSPVPVIIDIDEESLQRFGQWPWPRYRLASLLEAATSRGAAAIALDILLAEPDRSSPGNIRESLYNDLGLSIDFTGLPPDFQDYDSYLAGQIATLPVVLAMYARFNEKFAQIAAQITEEERTIPNGEPGEFPRGVSLIERSRPGDIAASATIHQAPGASMPLKGLRDAAPLGLINVNPDSDGFVRRVPMLVSIGNRTYVNLALRALMVALDQDNLFAITGPDGLESIRVGEFSLPVSPEGNFIIPFTGPRGQYPYISAARLLDGSLPDDAFAGSILFVGTSAPGLMDFRAIPFDRVFPGVEIHAAVLDAILSGRSIVAPFWTPGLIAIAIIVSGLISGLIFAFASPKIYVPAATVLFAGLLGGSWKLFASGLFISPLYPTLTVAAQGVLMLVLRFWQEERQKQVLRRAFSRYVAPEVVRRITEHHGDLLAGEERELTIMFTDIRGFTNISEKLDPHQIVSLLNRYFTPMTALVRNSGGTLDKFIGDALMAFWNAPLPVENHPSLAVEGALAMQEELARLNHSLTKDFGVSIRMGAGVHTGKVYVGNMGSKDFVNYTIIGDNVNLTSRLEGLCAQFGLQTVVSFDTMRLCLDSGIQNVKFQPIDILRVKGRKQPVSVFTALRPEEYDRRSIELAAYATALAHYQNGEFQDAFDGFAPLAEQYPDTRLYDIYHRRIAHLLENPPREWNGVWTLETK